MSNEASELVNGLWHLFNSDHERGCEGRTYSCDCGYDPNILRSLAEAATALVAQEAEIAELRKALTRQCDNMAFVINHADIYGWDRKFLTELEQDRALLTKNVEGSREA